MKMRFQGRRVSRASGRFALVVLLLAFSSVAMKAVADESGECLTYQQSGSLPSGVKVMIESPSRASSLEVCAFVNPFYQRWDFDGDGVVDLAVLVQEKQGGRRGIAVVRGGSSSIVPIGIGHPVGAGGGDLRWMDAWLVLDKQAMAKQRLEFRGKWGSSFRGEALVLKKTESASGLVGWNGDSFVWEQLGD